MQATDFGVSPQNLQLVFLITFWCGQSSHLCWQPGTLDVMDELWVLEDPSQGKREISVLRGHFGKFPCSDARLATSGDQGNFLFYRESVFLS